MAVSTIAIALLTLTASSLAADTEAIELQCFDSFADEAAFTAALTTWEDGGIVDLSLDATEVKDGTCSMKIVPVGPNGTQPWATIYIPVAISDWSGAKTLELWVKNAGDTYLFFAVNIYEASGEPWALNSIGDAYIETAPGEFTKVKCAYNGIAVPAQFEGMVQIPFTSFEVPLWFSGDAFDNKLNLAEMDNLSFGLSTVDNQNKPVYVDAIHLLK